MPQRPRREQHRRRLLADVAVADDRVTRFYARVIEQGAQFCRGLQRRARAGERLVRRAAGTRDVPDLTGPAALAAGLMPVVEDRVARIDDGETWRADVMLHEIGIHDDGS